ncbi:hypothetical protein G647_01933 [Cladophialophora carrionii CBS 160.54]|uniref:Uncharacterized protein n=1 Tax=Cladophialophora carrionii CBS 160.54 TaxID=1279043 RepID=V9DRE3_9EURO|nr:uncharacterized protein G647_01933 [Cladophialophora carrionii CBS 160.54]ETI29480.1 hypothetical protein G647_01933 [Cladophialophora carrionii CBS 160.54]
MALHDTWANKPTNVDILDELIGKVETDRLDCINDMNDDSMWWYVNMSKMTIWEHVTPYVIPHGRYNQQQQHRHGRRGHLVQQDDRDPSQRRHHEICTPNYRPDYREA